MRLAPREFASAIGSHFASRESLARQGRLARGTQRSRSPGGQKVAFSILDENWHRSQQSIAKKILHVLCVLRAGLPY